MAEVNRVSVIFDDARTLVASALRMLGLGDIRDAAEKAWRATKRVADALILARTGQEPRTSGKTLQGLRFLSRDDSSVRELRKWYSARQHELHGSASYDGNYEPQDEVAAEILQTADFVQRTQDLADGR